MIDLKRHLIRQSFTITESSEIWNGNYKVAMVEDSKTYSVLEKKVRDFYRDSYRRLMSLELNGFNILTSTATLNAPDKVKKSGFAVAIQISCTSMSTWTFIDLNTFELFY